MSKWGERPAEERALLNPSFCSCLLWQASASYKAASQHPLPFDLSFLILPIILHRGTREGLPARINTSLAVWVSENPLVRSRVADRAHVLVPFTKEAMMFGGLRGLFEFKSGAITADLDWKKPIAADMKNSTEEVRSCMKKADFLGKWLGNSGAASTVMSILGVRP